MRRAVELGAVQDLNVPGVHDRRAHVSPSRTHAFSAILRCHCGSTLTAIVRSGRKHSDGSPGAGSIGYLCRRGSFDPKHSRPIMISEPTAIAWAKEQIEVKHGLRHRIAHPDAGYDPVKAARIEKERSAIYAQLLSPDNKVPKHVSNMALAALDERERINKAQGRAHLVLRRSVNWSAAASDINADLRAILTRIDLDTAMRQISADWVIDPGPRSPLLDQPPLPPREDGMPI